MELATRTTNLEIQLEELTVKESSPLVDKSLREIDLPKRFGCIIVAIKRRAGDMIFNPSAEQVIRKADILVALGTQEQFKSVEPLLA